jgi:DNA-directed RNA polymerase sigma subunit (sigma70/sigma32)
MTSGEPLVQQLATRRSIRTECNTILTSLNQTEQYVLRAIAGLDASIDTSDPEIGEAVALLVQKRLLRVNREQKQLIIEPPIFSAYIASNP